MGQAAKRHQASPATNVRSRIYEPFRQIGHITGELPVTVHSMGGAFFISSAIGKIFQVFDADKLNVKMVSAEMEDNIKVVAAEGEETYLGLENGALCRLEQGILKEKTRVCREGEYFRALLVLGDSLLVLTDGRLMCLSRNLKKTETEMEIPGARCFIHPNTYLNKVIVGLADGSLELWNFRSAKKIHTFACVSGKPITCLAQSTVVDILAAGFEDGTVSVFDARQDSLLFTLQAKSAPVTAVSFRSDSTEKPQLAIADGSGFVSVWKLDSPRSMDLLLPAHEGAVATAVFLPGQPVLLTSGQQDNSIKEWVMDEQGFRVLRSRTGHTAPVKRVRFMDAFEVLSCGDQSVRVHSLLNDSQSHELSQGSIESRARKLNVKEEDLRLPPVVAFDWCVSRDLRWDNLVTAHEGQSMARTWRIDNKTIGEHSLKSDAAISAVAMSPCGNFAVLGSVTGRIDVFNIQSGTHKRTFTVGGRVAGLAIDQLTKELVVLEASGSLTVFDFARPSKILHQEPSAGPATAFAFKIDNGLAAIATSDLLIHIFDLEARRIVRRFKGHTGSVRDLAFSGDGKWLVSAAQDGTIRTWDLPSGLPLDVLVCSAAPTSVSLSPTGDYLLSSHEDDIALHLWSNKTILNPLKLAPLSAGYLPSTLQSQGGLITLAESSAKWLTLAHLETIKARNKPVMPDQGPVKIPFFLDAALSDKRMLEGESVQQEQQEHFDQKLASLLGKDTELVAFLKETGSSQLHFEISSLDTEQTVAFLSFLNVHLALRHDFDMYETLLHVTLQAHKDTIRDNSEPYQQVLALLEETQRSHWGSLEVLLNQALCLTSFCRS